MRLGAAQDIPQLKALWATCFDDDEAYIAYFMREKARFSNTLVEERDGRIVSALYIVDQNVWMRGVSQKTAFIVGVATLPAYRAQGLAGGLLVECLRLLYARGYAMAHLHPFRHSYYRKFGFETVSSVQQVCLKKKDLSPLPGSLRVEQGYTDELLPLYQTCMQGYNGFVVRESMLPRVSEQLADGNCYFVRENGRVCGYALVYQNGSVLEIDELVCKPGPYAQALLYDVASCLPIETIQITATPAQSFAFAPCISRKQDYVMMRIINPEALQLRTGQEGCESFRLKDDSIPQNTGAYRAAASDGCIRIRRVEQDAEPMTVQGLAVRVAGYHNVPNAVFSPLQNFIFEKY